jgi:hypothetical protein
MLRAANMAHAHLNGSINLAGPEDVFRTVSSIAGETVTRIPDGTADACPGAAVASYEIFKRLRDDEEAILPGTRFQVSVPSHGPAAGLDSVLAAVPSGDLAVQWQVAIDRAIPDETAELSARLCDDVAFGYHLCAGPAEGVNDLSRLVALANAIAQRCARPPTWFSLPVPIDRDDEAYFAPLADLRLAAETHPYLGLVHEDGLPAIQRRIAAAKPHLPRFGVCTECGMGDRPRAAVLKLLWLQLGARV